MRSVNKLRNRMLIKSGRLPDITMLRVDPKKLDPTWEGPYRVIKVNEGLVLLPKNQKAKKGPCNQTLNRALYGIFITFELSMLASGQTAPVSPVRTLVTSSNQLLPPGYASTDKISVLKFSTIGREKDREFTGLIIGVTGVPDDVAVFEDPGEEYLVLAKGERVRSSSPRARDLLGLTEYEYVMEKLDLQRKAQRNCGEKIAKLGGKISNSPVALMSHLPHHFAVITHKWKLSRVNQCKLSLHTAQLNSFNSSRLPLVMLDLESLRVFNTIEPHHNFYP
ncbi:hypothetical protein M9H77_08547 [Catharanthus roseus]|uniref:Uncharacterized protein n=1 Tax=Catharanthus roseus TaxID=4058 RepID=A0ACC0BYA3_CATRO|nr:hypothetical protein M9H77_08547 [Catharanthus roseus]